MTGVSDVDCNLHNIELSKKVEQTKAKTRSAFLHLCAQKRIETITIKELTTLAGINRSTFYSHYTDIYDLRDQVLNDFTILAYQKAVPAITRIVNGDNTSENIQYLTDFYNENIAIFRAFLGENFDPQMMERMRAIIKSFIYAAVEESEQQGTEQAEYIIEYMAAGHSAIISKWSISEATISTEELITLIKTITMEGPIKHLLRILKKA